ncbi:hypothetical protein BSKO_11694 [Bryopsis sp. KO-2023]|nr:hypothetical protein BSKO_11694 [Bryopsis sp. KO-2023]
MISACGLSSFGGYMIGDLDIMFRRHAGDGLHLTYDDFCQMARVIGDRCSSISWEVEISSAPTGTTLPGDKHEAPKQPNLKSKLSPNGGKNSAQGVGGASGLAVKLRPPSLVREVIPLPACKYARISSKIQGIEVLIAAGDLYSAKISLPHLSKEWIEAIVDDATLVGDDSVSLSNAKLPLEGQAWFSLVNTQICLTEGRVKESRKHIDKASLLLTDDFFQDGHDYRHVLALCTGLASFYAANYVEALDKLDDALRLAREVVGINPLARRHESAALNNMGVCLQMLGRHVDAIRSYHSGRIVLGPPLAEHFDEGDPLGETLVRNLSRALRVGIAAPKLIKPEKETMVQSGGDRRKMVDFLEKFSKLLSLFKAVAGPPKKAREIAQAAPQKEGKKGKGNKSADKKGKKGKKGKKKSAKKSGEPAKFPGYPPRYALENAKTADGKKGKGKKKK